MNYDVSYFINKFQAIPEQKWGISSFIDADTGARCAQGHCGMNTDNCWHVWGRSIATVQNSLKEAASLYYLFGDNGLDVGMVNNGYLTEYSQPTPKQRILAALHDIKKLQQPEYKDITKDLAILPQEETADIKQYQPSFS